MPGWDIIVPDEPSWGPRQGFSLYAKWFSAIPSADKTFIPVFLSAGGDYSAEQTPSFPVAGQ